MSSDEIHEILEQHVSPDGLIKLVVFRDQDDISIGLDGFAWHTHADLFAQSTSDLEEVAVRNFVDAILGNRRVFVLTAVLMMFAAGEAQQLFASFAGRSW